MAFTTTIKWTNEVQTLKLLGGQGWTQTDLAEKYGVSRQRMKQVIDRYVPNWNDNYGQAVNRKMREEERFRKWGYKEDTSLYHAKREKFRNKKNSSSGKGWEWTVEFGDLTWPTHCPILGLELDFFAEMRQENSPSFDRIDPTKGYIKGNVQIMSWRANRIKNDGSALEHRKIAKYLDKTMVETPL